LLGKSPSLESPSHQSLSLHFNGRFPGEPGLAGFIEAKDDESGGDNWSCKTCKESSQIVNTNKPTNTQLFTGRMPFLSPNQQCQSTEGKPSMLLIIP